MPALDFLNWVGPVCIGKSVENGGIYYLLAAVCIEVLILYSVSC